jgi:hypothetical protein
MRPPAEILAAHNIHLSDTSPGRRYATCPQCSAKRSRANQSSKCLGVTIDAKGVRWGCNHCGWTGPEKGANGHAGEDVGLITYDYQDAAGTVTFQKVRNLPDRKPRFWLRRPDGKGGWYNGTKGVDTAVIYRLPEVTEAIALGHIIAVVEGEKDADNLWRIGIPATCNAHGAAEPGQKPKWTPEHSEQLRDADIVVFNDNDMAGYEHADAICLLSLGVAKRVRKLDLKPHWPDMPLKADVSDWLALGHSREELDVLLEWAREVGEGPKEDAPSDNEQPQDHLGEWDAGDDPGPIPPRQWLLGNQFCAGFISSIVAAGGAGKSALRLLQSSRSPPDARSPTSTCFAAVASY